MPPPPRPAWCWGTVPGLEGGRRRCVFTPLPTPRTGSWGPGLCDGEGDAGSWGGLELELLPPAPLAAGERKPAASSAVPGTRVLLLLLPSAAAALLLHPFIIRGGYEKGRNK